MGTVGTGVGTSLKLKQFNEAIQIVGVIPELGYAIMGLRNPEEPYSTELYDRSKFDEIVEIPREENPDIVETARRAAEEEGLLVGVSAASILYVGLKKAKELGPGKTVVAVLPDSGMKYLSTELYEG